MPDGDWQRHYPAFAFDITSRATEHRARTGRLVTPHGVVETPNFIFCGTKAALKGIDANDARRENAQIILSNTYHLMIQPGADVVERLGGLQKMTGWKGPMLTDSGGFQIFSMGGGSVSNEIKGRRNTERKDGGPAPSLLKITEEGAAFRSYLDGRKLFLSPEISIDVQRKLGADIILQLDECTPFHVDKDYTARSMDMSHRWGDRSLEEFMRGNDGRQSLYGIIQGGVYEDLREISCAYTKDRDFFGTAIGGSLGGSKEQMMEIIGWCMPQIHPDRPVHLLGVGGIDDILDGVRHGIDTFDCVGPTRIARHGWALVKGKEDERYNLRNARFREDTGPIDPDCDCHTCRNYSCGYLHHLLKAGELLGPSLVTLHNIHTMNRLMADIRMGIETCTLDTVDADWRGSWKEKAA